MSTVARGGGGEGGSPRVTPSQEGKKFVGKMVKKGKWEILCDKLHVFWVRS